MNSFDHQSRNVQQSRRAFTLIEMLVVIAIIGIIAAIGLPAISGMRAGDVMTAASRQINEDIALARQIAINNRSTVYIVFVTPEITDAGLIGRLGSDSDRRVLTNLYGGQFTKYALFAERSLGDQPGQNTRRYIGEWRTLPDGIFFWTNKFVNFFDPLVDRTNRALPRVTIPFPTVTGVATNLPCIAFNSRGQLSWRNVTRPSDPDEALPLARGSIFYARNRDGELIQGAADVKETPAGNAINNYNGIRIDWLTGRPRIERKQL